MIRRLCLSLLLSLLGCGEAALPGPGADLAGAPAVDLATPSTVDLAQLAPSVDLATRSCAASGVCSDSPQCGVYQNGQPRCCPRGDWCDTSGPEPLCRCGDRGDDLAAGCVCQGTPPEPGACGTGPYTGCA